MNLNLTLHGSFLLPVIERKIFILNQTILPKCSTHWPFCITLYVHVFVLISRQVAEQLMTIAYESGVNLFDTAEVYAGGRWV